MKNNRERIITKVSLRDKDEYKRRLGIRKYIKRTFSFSRCFFSQRNVRNKKNLFANASEVTVIKFGIGAKPRILVVKVIGLIADMPEIRPMSSNELSFCAAIFGIEIPFDF